MRPIRAAAQYCLHFQQNDLNRSYKKEKWIRKSAEYEKVLNVMFKIKLRFSEVDNNVLWMLRYGDL